MSIIGIIQNNALASPFHTLGTARRTACEGITLSRKYEPTSVGMTVGPSTAKTWFQSLLDGINISCSSDCALIARTHPRQSCITRAISRLFWARHIAETTWQGSVHLTFGLSSCGHRLKAMLVSLSNNHKSCYFAIFAPLTARWGTL